MLKDLIKKMAAAPKKSRGFPYKKGSIILLLLIGALVMFDWKKHGSFEGELVYSKYLLVNIIKHVEMKYKYILTLLIYHFSVKYWKTS